MRRELNFFSRVQSQIRAAQFEAYKILNPAQSLDTDKKRGRTGWNSSKHKAPRECAQSHSRSFGFASIRASLGFAALSQRGRGWVGECEGSWSKRGCREEKEGRKREQREQGDISKVCELGGG